MVHKDLLTNYFLHMGLGEYIWNVKQAIAFVWALIHTECTHYMHTYDLAVGSTPCSFTSDLRISEWQ